MTRAFSPREHCHSYTWRVAPGWYESGLRPSEVYSNQNTERWKRDLASAGRVPGASPEANMERSFGPQNRIQTKIRSAESAFLRLRV